MDNSVKAIIEKRMEKTAEALRKNNMEAYIAKDSAQAVEIVRSLLETGDAITCGGTMTLKECGVTELMNSGDYNFIDRSKAADREEVEEVYRKAFFCDAYLTSANAITENGEIYNVDGNSNRIAAIAFGPKKVIVVAGYNKIVPTLADAVTRIKKLSAPANAVRLSCDTPCAQTGECVSLRSGGDMPKGCFSEARVCCNYLVSAFQRKKGRIKVVLVGEELGY